jgi:hypothetical protein
VAYFDEVETSDSSDCTLTTVKFHQIKVYAGNVLRSSLSTLNSMAEVSNNVLLLIAVSSHCDKACKFQGDCFNY